MSMRVVGDSGARLRSGLAAVAILLGACSAEPRIGGRAVSSRTLERLEAGSAPLHELAVKRTPGGYLTRTSWDAPPSVEVPVVWRHGLPHVAARLNGHEVLFILDSGSQGTVIEADTALRCGVRTASKGEGMFTLSGISGSEQALMGVPERVEIGDWRWEGLPCLVRTTRSEIRGPWEIGSRRLAINVLGMDVLRRMCSYVTIDYPNSRAVFGFRTRFEPRAGSVSCHVPGEWGGGLLHVRVGDGRTRWRAVVDTGSSSCVEINREVAEETGLRELPTASPIVRLGVGTERADVVKVTRLRSLEHLGPLLTNVPALVVPDCSKVGSGLFRPFRVTLDFQRRRLWFEEPR